MCISLCSNIEQFNQKSLNGHSSNDGAFTSAKQAAVRALNQPLSDRLTDIVNNEENVVTTPASKRPRYDPPSCVISDDDDEEDIGHVKVLFECIIRFGPHAYQLGNFLCIHSRKFVGILSNDHE